MEFKNLLKDKKFWFASFLIAWAAALQLILDSWIDSNFNVECGGTFGTGAYDVFAEAGFFQAEVWDSQSRK
ncbi:hypothetical protein Csa_008609 [Cucumis sativus]|nr:hypothetical protein Csa_008609 [Cucumis sativus]